MIAIRRCTTPHTCHSFPSLFSKGKLQTRLYYHRTKPASDRRTERPLPFFHTHTHPRSRYRSSRRSQRARTTNARRLHLLRIQPTLLHRRLHPPHIFLHILPIQLRRLCIRRTVWVRIMQQTLYTRQDRSNIIRRRPSILQNIETELAICVHVRVEHSRQEFDRGGFVRVGFIECEEEFESAVFEGRVTRTKNDGVP